MNRSWACLAAVVALVLGISTPVSAQDEPALVRYVAEQVSSRSIAAVEGRVVEIDPDVLERTDGTFDLTLPDGVSFRAVRTHLDRRGANDFAWRGRLQGDAASSVVLTRKGDIVVGRVVSSTGLYELRTAQGGVLVFERLDPSLFPACSGGVEPPVSDAKPGMSRVGVAEDPANDIKVMAVYTPQARDSAGGVAQIEATIQAAVDNTNAAFANSNMIARIDLVHTELANRNDSGNLSSDLNWLASDATVATRRDQFAADMVSLIVENGGGCGIGFVMRSPGASFESSAFQVTLRSCAVGNLTYAHEHGHNMGFEHDPANGTSPSNASYPWSFGHFVNGSYRTVMSYSNQCSSGCTRVTQFSNPDVNFNGVPTGIADQRDNSRSGDLTAPIVADFRTSATCGNGIKEAAEECDGLDLGGASCTGSGCTGGTLLCTPTCTLDTSNCAGCPTCDNDGVCEVGEDCVGCPNDCSSSSGATCGNGICEAGNGENCISCAADCNGRTGGKPADRFCCGDGGGPNPVSCSDARCTSSGFACTSTPVGAACCGDGVCSGSETSCSCAVDCGGPLATELFCSNGIDDDCDGAIDCNDADCNGVPECPSCFTSGASCTSDSQCCSNKCKGPRNGKTCQ